MVHLAYCDNTGKSGDKELDKIKSRDKTMVVRGAAGIKNVYVLLNLKTSVR